MFSNILLYLTALDPVVGGMLLVVLPTVVAMGLVALIRWKVGYNRLRINNELAAVKFGMIGLTYVMLLTFATLSAWEKFSEAQSIVSGEAAAANAIYILSDSTAKEEVELRAAVKNYLNAAIEEEWPAMENEQYSPRTSLALQNLYVKASNLDKVGSQTTQLAAEIFKHIDKINDSRQARIILAKGIVPELVWSILTIGAFITIATTLFFGGESLLAQIVMTGMTTVIMLLALLVIISFDHPFTGDVHVGSEPLQLVLMEMH